jgi:cell division protein FtsW
MEMDPTILALQKSMHTLGRGLLFRREERGPISWYFVVTLLAVLAYGLVMLFSASYATGYYRFNGDSYHFIRPQFFFAVAGVVLMFVISRINYRWIRRFLWPLYGATLLLLVLALFSEAQNGCHRWVYLPGTSTSLQPSELAKFCVILSTASIVDAYREKRRTLRYGIVYPALPLVPILLLLYKEPHFSGMVLILLIFFTMLICGGCGLKWIGAIVLAGGGAMLFLLSSQNNYVQQRLQGWTLFSGDTSTMLYQTKQSLYSIASGGLLGLGIGNSRQKHLWLPEANNDFIFSVLCEELGFVGAVLCIALFAALIIQGILIALRAPDVYGTLLGVGIISQIAWQVACNIAVVTNTIPNTGISLPFFSSGGTSLLMLLAEMGILLSISRAGNGRVLMRRKLQQAEFSKRLNNGRIYHRGETL